MSTKKDEVRYSVEALRWERALKLALEALEYFCVSSEDGEDLTPVKIKKAIAAIKEAQEGDQMHYKQVIDDVRKVFDAKRKEKNGF